MQPRLSRRRARSITSPHGWKAKKQKENAINAKTRFLSRTAAVKQWLCLHARKTRNYRPQDGEPREALSCEMMMQPFTKNLARSKKAAQAGLPSSCQEAARGRRKSQFSTVRFLKDFLLRLLQSAVVPAQKKPLSQKYHHRNPP